MRARRGVVGGTAAVVAYAALIAAVSVAAISDRSERPGSNVEPAEADEGAASALVDAWERGRRATFVTTGTYERHSEVTGASIASEDYVAQRPPERIHRQLGGVNGRHDDRLVVCPAPPPDETEDPPPCRLGEPGGPTYAESVADEIAGLRSILLGPDPLYSVAASEPGCFDLELRRIDPRAPFGVAASFCFDPATGAPTDHRVRHEGGIEERVVVTDVRTDVTDADLEGPRTGAVPTTRPAGGLKW